MRATHYTGRRTDDGPNEVLRHFEDGTSDRLDPRFDLANHSPDGFEWGYGGSGPSQLALALLADVVGDELAPLYKHDFKFKVIANIDTPRWKILRSDVVDRVIDIARADIANAGVLGPDPRD